MTLKLVQSTADELISEFDFTEVQSVMRHLNWVWRDGGVPTIEQMHEMVRYLVGCCKDEEQITTGCGGFEVTRYKDYYKLSFVVESCHVGGE